MLCRWVEREWNAPNLAAEDFEVVPGTVVHTEEADDNQVEAVADVAVV